MKTTVAIAVGDTIADSGVGANVEATSILDVISELNAANIAYNNTSSGLTATDVQGAIDEVRGDNKVINITNTITPSSEYVSGDYRILKCGKIVYVALHNITTSSSTGGITLLTGLPTVAMYVGNTFEFGKIWMYADELFINKTSNINIFGSFSYICQ